MLKLQNYAAFLLTSHDARIFEFLAISVKKAVLTAPMILGIWIFIG
ncbi:hypothetical protein D1BOALGB6SA_918 [Olavius sp. associated proteobacterium Delta 1]|nr:hypothetical protein D1BOALGB6SA_918 [Olavius sp. associated proteobacterium Delta 1]